MNGNEIVELARRTYMEELAQFVLRQAGSFKQGAAEVQGERPGDTPLFGGHYRSDFVGQRGERALPMDLVPDRRVRLDTPVNGTAGAMSVRMEQLVWDDVAIAHDAPGDLTAVLTPWFEHWYDPDDKRKPTVEGQMVDVIHSLGVYPGSLVVDFGSASTGAFWTLVALLRDAGASGITISETRAAPRTGPTSP